MQNPSRKKFVITLLSIIFGSLIILGGSITALVLHLVRTEVTGNLLVDGSTFTINKCRSGQVFGFYGIQLSDATGRRLKVIEDQTDGKVTVSLFPANQDTGDILGNCVALHMRLQNSRVNYIANVGGAATFDCGTGNHKVVGDVNFTNCH